MLLSFILGVFYLIYVLFVICENLVIFYDEFLKRGVTWWTLYPVLVTAATAMFNWEFWMFCKMFERPAEMAAVWFAFILLFAYTACAYINFPRLRRNARHLGLPH